MPTKKCNVLIEFPASSALSTFMTVWADAELADDIRSIEGVARVWTEAATEYAVTIDKRYDRQEVADAISAHLDELMSIQP